jgi:23S rRNA (cytosine1962-C5)-methyltransferase
MSGNNTYPKIFLKPGKEAFLERKHPWIFSGALHPVKEKLADGTVVEVFANHNNYLATGHYFSGSIAVRILSFEQRNIDADFWSEKIQSAFDYRSRLCLTDNPTTNCYRLINAEGDGLPGLIIDYYNGTAVFQAHTSGMYFQRELIAEVLRNIYGNSLKAVFDKSDKSLQQQTVNSYIFGKPETDEVLENGNRFKVNWETGQKTGFFLDQRDNRLLLSQYAKDKTVLNAFCYSGGFSVYALNAGAAKVDSVDVSKTAIELTDANIALCNASATHQSYTADVLEFLQQSNEHYDVMIIDPPAFAKNIGTRHNAVQGYKRLNEMGLKKIAKGGILFTFSCSQVVDRELFYNTIMASAIEAKRKVRVMHHLNQPADHPVNIFHPEGHYLKGLALFVE